MLEVELCDIKMKNPTMLAAGVLGSTASSLNWASRSGAGAVVTKSFGLHPNKGYVNPTTVEVTGGIINAIGLSNPGVDTFYGELEKIEKSTPTVASIYGASKDEFSQIAAKVENLVDIIELNVSCPHAQKGCGASIGADPELTGEIVKAVKKAVEIPVIAKLTPNVTDIVAMAKAVEEAGADAISMINTLIGMVIDVNTWKPVLGNITGGLSGPAVKPVAIRMVWQVAQAVKIPIIGMGGIMTAEDAIEFFLAGASAVAVGTANFVNPSAVEDVARGIQEYLVKKNLTHVSQLIGQIKINK